MVSIRARMVIEVAKVAVLLWASVTLAVKLEVRPRSGCRTRPRWDAFSGRPAGSDPALIDQV